VGAALSACSQPPHGEPGMIERTVVVLHADGSQNVTTESITVEEQRAEVEARAQLMSATASGLGSREQAITNDPSCAASSLWIFDNRNNTGGSWPDDHEICFYAGGVTVAVDLTQYTRYCQPLFPTGWSCNQWGVYPGQGSGPILSYWAGSDSGKFVADGELISPFQPWQWLDDPSSDYVVSHAFGLNFN
jgi:hypothetical protein